MQMFKNIILIFFFVGFIYSVPAQNTGIVKSDKKVMIKGKAYFIHIVKKGQTLYSICKAYSVLQRDVVMHNPKLFEGLKEGQELKIPVNAIITEDKITDNYIYHTVQKGETVYSLSKKYKVKKKDIYRLNPSTKDNIKIGQTIKIKKSKIKYPREDDNFIYIQIEKKQTLYSITHKYDVSREKIYKANPGLKAEGLKYNSILKIPKKEEKPEKVLTKIVQNDTIESKDPVLLPDSLVKDSLLSDSLISDSLLPDSLKCIPIDYSENPTTYNIVYLLPLDKDAQMIENEVEMDEIEKVFPKPFFEFYEGALIAIKEMQEKGLNLNIYVFDTGKDSLQIVNLLKKKELKNADLIIGPVYTKTFLLASEFCKTKNIPIISPLSPNDNLIKNYKNSFQIVPAFYSQLEQGTMFLSKSRKDNFIILHNDTKEERELIFKYKKILKSCYFENHNDSINLRIISLKETKVKDLKPLLKLDSNRNIIIIPSKERAFVSNAVTKLYIEFNRDYDITLVGFSVWQTFENISLEYFHTLNFHTFEPFFIDYKDSSVKVFIKKYRDLYNSEPEKYSFYGYDISKFFLTALMNYGKNFSHCLDSIQNVKMLNCKMKFSRLKENSGFINECVYIINYNRDYEVVRVREKDLIKEKDLEIKKPE